MVLDGGAFLAEGAGKHLLATVAPAGELTIEALVTPADDRQSGPARIVTLSTDASTRNVTLGQERGSYVLRLRTPRTGANGTKPQLTLGPVAVGRATHVVVTYRPGRTEAYLDGRRVLRSDRVAGDLSNWTAQQLLFGDEANGGRDWAGTLSHVAIYARALDGEEVAANAQAVAQLVRRRAAVPRITVDAELLAVSRPPTLAEIAPYHRGLLTSTVDVRRVVSAEGIKRADVPKRLGVVRWAILDDKPCPAAKAHRGAKVRLTLEPYLDQPQLEALTLNDTLAADGELWYCPQP
jgi:hypothetical protein